MNDDENVTVMSPDELDIKDEDLKNVETQEVTVDVTGTVYYKRIPGGATVTVSFALANVPVDIPDENLKGHAINALHDALIKEEVIKCKTGTTVMLQATDDISRVLIENITVRKGE